ncbi:MAG: class I SAM-dependent rRNA methyltransferase, partial [Myxococcales bacterium FL481]
RATGYRVVNSEGDKLPGLTVDRYEDDLVVQLTTAPMAARQAAVTRQCQALVDGTVFVTRPETAARREGFAAGLDVVGRDPPSQLSFGEHGLRFRVPAPPAQKTGAYFDQRENRRRVAEHAASLGGPLLDLGCYVGGFALHAAARGVSVVGVDRSEAALALARENAERNRIDQATWIEADIFADLVEPALAGPFSVVVFDPPKVAASKSHVRAARAAMTRALTTILSRVAPGGLLAVCSCSHHVDGAVLDRCLVGAAVSRGEDTEWTRLSAHGPGVDHPVAPGHREGHYLQMLLYRRAV